MYFILKFYPAHTFREGTTHFSPDGRFLAVVPLCETDNWHPARTALCRVEPWSGKLSEALTLPSGGDTSYAGMAFHEGLLWVSYFSSHEEKMSIYLATVKVEN